MTQQQSPDADNPAEAQEKRLLHEMEKLLNRRAKRSAWYAFSVLAVIIVLAVMSAVIIIGVVQKAGDDVRYISFSEIEASEDLLKLQSTYVDSVAQRYRIGAATLGELATTTQNYFDLERTYYRDLADIAPNTDERFRVEGKLITPKLLNKLVDNLRNEQVHAEQLYRTTKMRAESGVGTGLDSTIAKAYLRKTASMLDRYERYAHELGLTLQLNQIRSPFESWSFGHTVTQIAIRESRPAPDFDAILESADALADTEPAAGEAHSYDGVYTSKVDAFLSAPISDRFQQLVFYSTRLTSVLLIALIIKFLVPLFRYLLRLSTFYLARADAIRLGDDIDSISKAATLFTPDHDFDPGKVELGIENIATNVANKVIGR